MCSTPLIASSSGVPTVCASTVGFAPGYTARTVIVGGVTSGYSLIGSAPIANSPPARMTSEMHDHRDVGRSLLRDHAEGAYLFGQARERLAHAILHLHLRQIDRRADLEG